MGSVQEASGTLSARKGRKVSKAKEEIHYESSFVCHRLHPEVRGTCRRFQYPFTPEAQAVAVDTPVAVPTPAAIAALSYARGAS